MNSTNYLTVVHNEEQAEVVKKVAKDYGYTNNLELDNINKLLSYSDYEDGLVLYFENELGKKGLMYSSMFHLEAHKDEYHDITVRPTVVELTAAETRIKFKENRNFVNLMASPSTDKPVDELITEQSHYREAGIEPIEIMRKNMTNEQFYGFLLGNSIKYITRHERKNKAEDLRKAKTYITWMIEEYENGNKS